MLYIFEAFYASENSLLFNSGVNGIPVYRILFRLGRNDKIHKEYSRTGY